MKNTILAILVLCSSAFAFCNGADEQYHKPPEPLAEVVETADIEVAFAPNNGGVDCTDLIVKQINASKESIFIQAYNFTSEPIGVAICAAAKRGVQVHIILDHVAAFEKGCQGDACKKSGCDVLYDSDHKIAHNKVMIIDSLTVIGGSFNYSLSAETHNAENCTVIHNKSIAALYLTNWSKHQVHSNPVLAKK